MEKTNAHNHRHILFLAALVCLSFALLFLFHAGTVFAAEGDTLTIDTAGHGESLVIDATDDTSTLYDCVRASDSWTFEESDGLIMDSGEVLLGFGRQPMSELTDWDAILSTLVSPETPVSDLLQEDGDSEPQAGGPVLYLVWAKPIDHVECTIAPPKAGSETDTVAIGEDEDGNDTYDLSTQTNRPVVTTDGEGYHLARDTGGDCAYWWDYRWPYRGTFEAGEIYSFYLHLEVDPGYVFLVESLHEPTVHGGDWLECWRNGLVFDLAREADINGYIEGYLKVPAAEDEEEDDAPDEEDVPTAGAAENTGKPHTPPTGDESGALPFLLLAVSGALLLGRTAHLRKADRSR